MKKIILLCLLITTKLLSEGYNFNWYPKENSDNNVVEMPNKDKFSMFLPDGVWEDSLGNYGNMSCVVSAFTTINKDVDLNGYCVATDNKKDKFWINLSRNSFESAGVGQMTFIDGTNKYKNLIGLVCPYGVLWIDNESRRSRGQGSIIKAKCSKDKEIDKRLGL